MGRIRRGGYVFIAWKGDHDPEHVHVLKDGKLVAKWDLEKGEEIVGRANRRVRRLIRELQEEGRLWRSNGS